ncbi:MAG: adenylate/guanylate cyclase domain-containing protein [Sphaerospermopsis sp. SIO1G1]|nr:adenylate/guanylate cyclase domain-containing protein [Sphaerospermopsis sp. SIO1G1]
MMEKIKKFLREWRDISVITSSMTGFVILLRFLGLLQSLEWAVFDQYMRLRPHESKDERIVIVGISETDLHNLQQGYINDDVYARLIKKLKEKKPRAIGLDIYRDLPFQPGHENLVQVFKSTEYLVGIEKVVPDRNGNTVSAPPVLKELGQVGANDVVVDSDNTVRRGFMYLADKNNNNVYSFSLYLALLYLNQEGITVNTLEDGITWQLGQAVFPQLNVNEGGYIRTDNGGYQVLINYRGEAGYFETVSLTDILEDRVPQDWGRDRIILIGTVGESFKDLFYTPYSAGLLSLPEPMSGVEVQANLISQILSAAIDGRPLIHSWPEVQEYLWIIFWALIGAIVSWQWRYVGSSWKLISLGSTLVLSTGILFVSTYTALIWGLWIPVVPPFLAMIGSVSAITAYIARSANLIRKTFGRYLSNEVVANLLESPDGLKIGGKRREITIVTSDLRGFTALSEQLDPEVVVQILNIYLEFMLDVITKYQGTVDKFMGDGIVILFGAPTLKEDDAERALACAIDMQLTMKNVNAKLQELDLPSLAMGIGINTGEVVVGNIGSEKHTEYTVIGKEMNLAFRIEGYTTGKQILISEPTLKAIKNSHLRIDGEMQVKPKGVQELITIYDLGGIGEPYNLFLTKETDQYFNLREPIPISYQILEGKNVSNQIFAAYLIKLSETGAEVKTELANSDPLPAPLSNIKLNLLRINNQKQTSEDIYAKILNKSANPSHFYIQFTFKPAAEAEILFQYLQKSIIANN